MKTSKSLVLFVLPFLLAGCREDPIDEDGDGFIVQEDCDDTDADINPDAEEICDEIDNNCDGNVDEDSATDAPVWYADADADGFGDPDPDTQTRACEVPSGFVEDNTDCDDASAEVHPDADEVCGDSVDNNCDTLIDDPTAADVYTWYEDADGDNWGNDGSTDLACTQPFGYVANGGDCDDTDASYNPMAPEFDCEDPNDYNCDGSVGYADEDEDGFPACEDCDDSDGGRNEDADEVCDEVDNDCDGDIDEDAVDAPTWYADADGDTHGGTQFTATECEAPAGYVASSDDCDDLEPDAYPGNTEVCDEIDNDCDTFVDESDAADASTWYADVDADGYGDAASSTLSCEQPTGYVEDATDCDDSEATTNPGALEYCDGVDNDCDASTDEDDAEDVSTWYRDADEDGYGYEGLSTEACDQPNGFVSDNTDCADQKADINPGATEYCDELDNDCDGETDEDDADDVSTFYADVDGDGYGDADSTTGACSVPTGYVEDDTDCDDSDANASPGATEYCDNLDNDCDGDIDEDDAADATTWYADDDGDGYGDSDTSSVSCEQPSGYVSDATDCDDSAGSTNPSNYELCDGADNDCDGDIDESDAVDVETWYADSDGDGYADEDSTTEACDQPSGYLEEGDDFDCDDTDEDVSPGSDESCGDEVDNNCDGEVDEDDAADAITWYLDSDEDGYGFSSISQEACSQPSGYVADATDCDDDDSNAYPTNTEVCDDADNDCDGDTDEDDADDAETWYADSDEDGFGDEDSATVACDQPSGYVEGTGDCDDTNASVNEDQDETCDGIDNDCDGDTDEDDAADAETWYADADGDGHGDGASDYNACSQPSGYVANTDDCDDEDADLSPDATEVCDDQDNDCDGDIDEDDASDASTWYADGDGDGYGDPNDTTTARDQPNDYTSDDSDCDDDDSNAYPNNSEVCDYIDNDCDGDTDEDDASDVETWYVDLDGDGYGNASSPTESCDQPSGYVSDATDCDDGEVDSYPNNDEVCDEVDNDCDGLTDEDDADDVETWYADSDGDGYGDGDSTTTACEQPSDYVTDATDCDDDEADAYPGNTETCDSVDNDCDGETDEGVTTTWYADADSDGYGDASSSSDACDQPSGYVTDATDCDDDEADAYPGNTETCDSVDNDCDGETDEGVTTTWYADADGDGYGDEDTTTDACDQPSDYVTDATDCDDAVATTNPGADENCDSVDNDCDGETDEDAVDTVTWYADVDGDEYGDEDSVEEDCDQISGYIREDWQDDFDCDDANAAVNPGAEEVCDEVDNDCDGEVDEDDAEDTDTWSPDADGDGYGDPNSTTDACDQPAGYVALGGEDGCDDTDADVNPAATEVCNGVDDDCDGDVDADASDTSTWHNDNDSDGYGDEDSTEEDCNQPSGYVAEGDLFDCDDSDATVYPLAGDTYGDGVDSDCDDIDCEAAEDSNGVYFVACPIQTTYSDSADYCMESFDQIRSDDTVDGYYMASMRDDDEADFIADLMADAGMDHARIGYTDIDSEGTFTWDDGYSGSYTDWYSGEPNNENDEDCAQLQANISYAWNDGDCDNTAIHGFICNYR